LGDNISKYEANNGTVKLDNNVGFFPPVGGQA
jgi:hypothetical protein